MYKVGGRIWRPRVYGQDLAVAQALPQNDTWTGTPIKAGRIEGAIEIAIIANTALTLADGKTLTINLRHAGPDLNFTDLDTAYQLTAAAGNGSIAADTELGRFALPSSSKFWVLATITTDDAAADGKLDLITCYTPR